MAVGVAAAATHLAVVVVLVEGAGLAPLLANVAGWGVAFGVSFIGHLRGTFSASGVGTWAALRRFLPLSLAGFLVNEAAYAGLLARSPAGYAPLLAAVLVGVAVLTFVLSRAWAFRRTAPPDRPAR